MNFVVMKHVLGIALEENVEVVKMVITLFEAGVPLTH
jgi:hypothetical protein